MGRDEEGTGRRRDADGTLLGVVTVNGGETGWTCKQAICTPRTEGVGPIVCSRMWLARRMLRVDYHAMAGMTGVQRGTVQRIDKECVVA